MPVPTKKGYTFKGWFSDSEFTGEINKIEKGKEAYNHVLFAKWEEKSYNISFKISAGGEVFNKWITDGFLNVYDLSIFNDEKLFITLLPIYFQKKIKI